MNAAYLIYVEVLSALFKTYGQNIGNHTIIHLDVQHVIEGKHIHEILVDLDLEGYSFSIEDIIIFNFFYYAKIGYEIPIDFDDVMRNFTFKCFLACCESLRSHPGYVVSSQPLLKNLIKKLEKIDKKNPFLFADLYEAHQEEFYSAVYFTLPFNDFSYHIAKWFNEKQNIWPDKFTSICARFNKFLTIT